MARFGINPENTLGISIPTLRKMAKSMGKDHRLALRLWHSEIHEARILAAFIDEPGEVTEEQMDEWVAAFDSWDVCDQVCANLFDRTPFAYEKALEWSARSGEFEKRAGFALMAALAWHDKQAPDEKFLPFLPVIEREAADERNFVKKAVNWALRQIGKRNEVLNRAAIATAERIGRQQSKAARWTASDALRELTSEKLCQRLRPQAGSGRE
ncbi:MAG: DNA alkylation repair protein [Actinobacteria bacterium]|nr:MAG: DNA alkylation repair protein [Actinomycetota bacterium]